MHLLEELEQRELLNQYTHEKLFDLYNEGGQTLYVGMDPSADSLHLGNFVGFMHAVQYMKRNNKLIFIVGGATGMIGDPGGKDTERNFLDEETLQHNVQAIKQQVQNILANLQEISGHTFEIEVINNASFYQNMSYLGFLRKVGKHISINQMISKETVKKRIEDPDKSISYTEFSYMLIQAYDFLQLFQKYNCQLQIAGSDQWGNIVTGIELIRKKTNKEAFGATTPLVLDATGKKFGKSEGNALRLDPNKNSPFIIYQYFMNTSDEDVERYLKLLTLLNLDTIQEIVHQHNIDTSLRYGQAQLAYYIVQTIFGKESAEHAMTITELLFHENKKIDMLHDMEPSAIKALNQSTGGVATKDNNIKIADFCTLSGITNSNGEAKKMIKQGLIHINEQKINDIDYIVKQEFAINNIILIRKGKKTRKSVLFI